jgi:hypothetical protein
MVAKTLGDWGRFGFDRADVWSITASWGAVPRYQQAKTINANESTVANNVIHVDFASRARKAA